MTPWPRERTAASTSSNTIDGVSGRAASCTSTVSIVCGSSARPRATDSWRVSPPATTSRGADAAAATGSQARSRLVDAVAGHHDHEVRRLAHAEHGIHGHAEDRVAAERDERLRLGVPEPGAAARGDDDDGDR